MMLPAPARMELTGDDAPSLPAHLDALAAFRQPGQKRKHAALTEASVNKEGGAAGSQLEDGRAEGPAGEEWQEELTFPSHLLPGLLAGRNGSIVPANKKAKKQAKREEIWVASGKYDMIEVARKYIPKVIGPGGSMVKRIRELTGAAVNARDQSTDPVRVLLTGEPPSIRKAQDMIREMVEDMKRSDQAGIVLEIPNAKIGKVFGIRGAQINEIQVRTGAKLNVEKDGEPCILRVAGTNESIAQARKMIETLTMDAPDDQSEYLDFPRSLSGAILGVGGSRLSELRAESGAQIDVDKTEMLICRVRIAGTAEQIELAKLLVEHATQTTRPPEEVLQRMKPRKVIARGLPASPTDVLVATYFEPFGEIEQVVEGADGSLEVTFGRADDAELATKELDGTDLGETRVKCELLRQQALHDSAPTASGQSQQCLSAAKGPIQQPAAAGRKQPAGIFKQSGKVPVQPVQPRRVHELVPEVVRQREACSDAPTSGSTRASPRPANPGSAAAFWAPAGGGDGLGDGWEAWEPAASGHASRTAATSFPRLSGRQLAQPQLARPSSRPSTAAGARTVERARPTSAPGIARF